MPVIYLINGNEVEASDDEVRGIIASPSGLCVLRSGETINKSSIAHIVPDGRAAEIRRAKAKHGRLHDGTRVVRKFGQWVDADNPDVLLSPRHYPEIARDEVVSEEEWNEGIRSVDRQALNPGTEPQRLPPGAAGKLALKRM